MAALKTYNVSISDRHEYDQRDGHSCRELLTVAIAATDHISAAKEAMDRLTHWPLLHGDMLAIEGKLEITVEGRR